MQSSASLADVGGDAGAYFSAKEKQSMNRLSGHLQSNLRTRCAGSVTLRKQVTYGKRRGYRAVIVLKVRNVVTVNWTSLMNFGVDPRPGSRSR
jgi:hypothetical protein